MAHNLASKSNGSAAMFYTGESPWHGLGTHLDRPATSAEAMAASGLDYEVTIEEIQTASGLKVPMGKAAVRSDTKTVIGNVGNRWTPVQNREAFSFLDSLVGEGQISYHTAGALGEGEQVWMLAKLGQDIRVTGSHDVIGKFLLLSNSHNGLTSLRCFFTPIRVVCQNTLSMASKWAAREGVKIRHTGNVFDKLAQAREVLGLADAYYNMLGEQINAMNAVKLDRARVLSYFKKVYPAPADAEKSKRAAVNSDATVETLVNLFENGRGNSEKNIKHSLWAAYNAVTEFVDHAQENNRDAKRSIEQAKESRLNRIWFGQGANEKGRAFEAAMAIVRGDDDAPKAKPKAKRRAAAV